MFMSYENDRQAARTENSVVLAAHDNYRNSDIIPVEQRNTKHRSIKTQKYKPQQPSFTDNLQGDLQRCMGSEVASGPRPHKRCPHICYQSPKFFRADVMLKRYRRYLIPVLIKTDEGRPGLWPPGLVPGHEPLKTISVAGVTSYQIH